MVFRIAITKEERLRRVRKLCDSWPDYEDTKEEKSAIGMVLLYAEASGDSKCSNGLDLRYSLDALQRCLAGHDNEGLYDALAFALTLKAVFDEASSAWQTHSARFQRIAAEVTERVQQFEAEKKFVEEGGRALRATQEGATMENNKMNTTRATSHEESKVSDQERIVFGMRAMNRTQWDGSIYRAGRLLAAYTNCTLEHRYAREKIFRDAGFRVDHEVVSSSEPVLDDGSPASVLAMTTIDPYGVRVLPAPSPEETPAPAPKPTGPRAVWVRPEGHDSRTETWASKLHLLAARLDSAHHTNDKLTLDNLARVVKSAAYAVTPTMLAPMAQRCLDFVRTMKTREDRDTVLEAANDAYLVDAPDSPEFEELRQAYIREGLQMRLAYPRETADEGPPPPYASRSKWEKDQENKGKAQRQPVNAPMSGKSVDFSIPLNWPEMSNEAMGRRRRFAESFRRDPLSFKFTDIAAAHDEAEQLCEKHAAERLKAADNSYLKQSLSAAEDWASKLSPEKLAERARAFGFDANVVQDSVTVAMPESKQPEAAATTQDASTGDNLDPPNSFAKATDRRNNLLASAMHHLLREGIVPGYVLGAIFKLDMEVAHTRRARMGTLGVVTREVPPKPEEVLSPRGELVDLAKKYNFDVSQATNGITIKRTALVDPDKVQEDYFTVKSVLFGYTYGRAHGQIKPDLRTMQQKRTILGMLRRVIECETRTYSYTTKGTFVDITGTTTGRLDSSKVPY